MSLFLALCHGLLIDACIGEPRRYHPLVGFGIFAEFLEKKCNRSDKPLISILSGVFAWTAAIVPLCLILAFVYFRFDETQFFLDIVLVYVCVGRKSLHQHVKRVYTALNENDIEQAKLAVGSIVSRNVSPMEEGDIRKAAIESALENGSDALFAPVLWFVLGGAPAVLAYRLVNTLDAMWGYRNARYEYFGKCSARMDDLVNWGPARLVALSYALVGNTRLALTAWIKQAPLCSSPNAGPVMSAGAGSLNIRLGGRVWYHGRALTRPTLGSGLCPENDDILRSLKLIDTSLLIWLTVIFFISLLVHHNV